MKTANARAGLNGNYHAKAIHDPCGHLDALGVAYLGDGAWTLPTGAGINSLGGDDWLLTMADGTEYHVWSED